MTYFAEPVVLRAIIVVGLLALLLGALAGVLLRDAYFPHDPPDPADDLFASVAYRIEQLDLDRQEREAILEHLCDTSRVAFLQAVQTSDFIHRLLEASPGLPAHQRSALLAIADEVLELARRVPQDAFAQAMANHSPRTETRTKSAWMTWDTDRVWRWLRDH